MYYLNIRYQGQLVSYVLVLVSPRSCTPFFQLKTLMQAEAGRICPTSGLLLTGARAGKAPEFHGNMWWTNGATLVTKGGAPSLWRGACPLVIRGALLASGQMLGYDGLKTYCKREAIMNDGPALHVAASVAAAFFSCSFSAPVRPSLSLAGRLHQFTSASS